MGFRIIWYQPGTKILAGPKVAPPQPQPGTKYCSKSVPNVLAALYQTRHAVAPNSGTPSRPIPVPRRDQFRYQFWINSGISFGPILVPVLVQIWYQFWTNFGTSFGPNLVQNRTQIWFKIGTKSGPGSTKQSSKWRALAFKMVHTFNIF